VIHHFNEQATDTKKKNIKGFWKLASFKNKNKNPFQLHNKCLWYFWALIPTNQIMNFFLA
jgi:hypothetical protein